MFSLRQPDDGTIRRFLATQAALPLTYAEVGASRATPPAGYDVDHHRVRLGAGVDAFARAKAALESWRMFGMPWLRLCWPDAPIAVGATVAVIVRILGVWSLNAARIVYLIDEGGGIERFGFAYGTLPGHAERGEERFTVEWRHDDDTVWYDVLAFSRPNQWAARLGYPLARRLQRRFAADSLAAMAAAAAGPRTRAGGLLAAP